jgi:hypothetical protein
MLQQNKRPLRTSDVEAESPPTPDLTSLLNAGMGIVIVDDKADFPHDSLLIVKQSAAAVVLKIATEMVGQVAAPFLLTFPLLCF